MKPIRAKQVVYLFGAGATHAELENLFPGLPPEKGLLIGNVSSRVIDRARKNEDYLAGLEMVTGVGGSLNVELLISLIENSKIHGWAKKSEILKKLVEHDIKSFLPISKTRRFLLHRSLLELHAQRATRSRETLIGLISLNYDSVLDEAFRSAFRTAPNYCFPRKPGGTESPVVPLLKLHGSFNWVNKSIFGKRRDVEIIPLGSSKSYLHVPYGFIWNRALLTLSQCDVLRVIGCALSPNDAHLIDLLFKTHLERTKPLEIEVIDFESTGSAIQKNYGFFPSIKSWSALNDPVMAEPKPSNPFKTWLKYKSIDLLKTGGVGATSFLKLL